VTATNEFILEGYELTDKKLHWREVALEEVLDVQPTLHTFNSEAIASATRKFPNGATVIVRARSPTSGHFSE
jgi:hypothetical protein